MSKCWYCNNELTSDDSPKHFGICNKCYDKMFKSGDTIIRSLTNKISDLESKLAECEKKAYSRGHSQRDIANEIKLNALREDVANKEKRIAELKQQLTEENEYTQQYRKDCAKIQTDYYKLKQQLHDLPKKIVEEIRDVAGDYWEECGNVPDLNTLTMEDFDEILDTILKKYGDNNESIISV